MDIIEKYGVKVSEKQVKDEMKEFGIPVPENVLAENPGEAEVFAEKSGLPVVMKIDSADIKHKTDVGAIKKVHCFENIRESFEELLNNVEDLDADINGVLVEECVEGNEFIAGINNDPQFGKVLMFGLGGIYVEVFEDVVFRPLPVDEKDVRDMLDEIDSGKLLEGVRGQPEADRDKLVEVLMDIAKFGENECIRELDVNPMFVKGNTVKVGDALLELEV